ncbi:hypothetical protein LCGC14_0609130 [marine sediment metagenome]|uniref:RNA polymerase sigma-70 domain-containing protein n=1 Tax=marine sediment metagenome TaxID=412755 RepID=A0A0F9R8H8_9ZZZZ
MKKLKITDYLGLVKYHAGRLFRRTPANVAYDDLFAAGLVGLNDAIKKYDVKKNDNFKAYATVRICGAMIDEMREMSWLTRWYSDKHKKTGFAVREMLTYSMVFENPVSVTKQGYMLGLSADLERSFNKLSMRERTILRMYYHDGIIMKDIAKLFGITEAAISQAHKRAVGSLKLMMRAG